MSLVKSILELHGGNIYAQSKLGEGSTFTIRLPVGKVLDENIIYSNIAKNGNEIIRVEFSDLYS
ncbi:hypothetical protein KTC96_08170 [Clostridium estertheticum]|uniref:hypothetical protein n=1 Tax=Clostridium estertheticum TaxID=238834 RepID=UPI001C7DCCA8|nr:hypothetical protein [Clostridium estertheticum]MBX4261105.1 hypothetical protein [Clostridium estertheticum]WLC71957.1 hypothetical protein KTC96_08170 [Clostridium estertheticum]